MDDMIYQKLANTLITIVADFQMNTEEIKAAIKTQGFDRFIQNTGRQTLELTEIAELLLLMEKRGERLEP